MQLFIHYCSTKFLDMRTWVVLNCKRTLDLIKHLLSGNNSHPPLSSFYDSDGQPRTSPAEIANSFNAYFSNIGCELAIKIAPSYKNHREYLKHPVPQSIFLSNVTSDEIVQIVQISRSLQQSHSPGLDQIDPTFAKISVPVIGHALAAIINCLFNSGIFPDALKIAKVIPLHKSDSKENITNYRPRITELLHS